MKNLVLNVAFPIVGMVLLAIFGPASIGLAAEIFANEPEIREPEGISILWATCGLLIFSIGEITFLFSDRLSGSLVATLIGRGTQVVGFAIALWALLSAMFWLDRVADPYRAFTSEGMASDLGLNETILRVGLWIVAVGQIVIGIGRHIGFNAVQHVSIKNQSYGLEVMRVLSLTSLILTLFAILALFAFTTIFEVNIHHGLQGPPDEIDIAWLWQHFQGMAVNPMLAYGLFIIYCSIDGIYFLVGKLSRPSSEQVI